MPCYTNYMCGYIARGGAVRRCTHTHTLVPRNYISLGLSLTHPRKRVPHCLYLGPLIFDLNHGLGDCTCAARCTTTAPLAGHACNSPEQVPHCYLRINCTQRVYTPSIHIYRTHARDSPSILQDFNLKDMAYSQ